MSRKGQIEVEKALRMLEAGRRVAAFRTLKRLAEAGEEHAYHMVGYLYDVGEGTTRNKKNAVHWYILGYEAGNSSSACNIATICRDAGEAEQEMTWYNLAAALGDADALLEVGLRYLSGKGVRRNIKRAIDLFKAVKADPHASENARSMARKLLYACPARRHVT